MSDTTPARRKRTAREIAASLGTSERTVRRIIAEPRGDYEQRARKRRAQAAALRVQGLKYREIADTMGCSIGTVSRLLHDARRHGELPEPNQEEKTADDAT